MSFPIDIRFRRSIRLNSAVDEHEVLNFIKRTVTEESPFLQKLNIHNNVFSFNVDFWGVSRGSTFDGVGKGRFSLERESGSLVLTYTYQIGGGTLIILPLIFGIPFLIFLFTDFKKNFSFAPQFLWMYISVSILCWFISLYKMNRLFKLVVDQVESKWSS
jgi:hypothetical protein